MTNNRLPNLIIPGVMKGSTTSLAATLGKHPDVFVIPMKEPMFFAQRPESREKLNEMLSPDASSYDSVTAHKTNDYLEKEVFQTAFAPGEDTRWRVDASTMYMPSPDAVRLAREMVPDAKFIAVLRNPYNRAYSAYRYQQSRLREPAPTFADAIREEREGKRDGWVYGWRHLSTSLYAEQIERLFEVVPEEDRLVVLMEEIVGAGGLEPIYDFLGLDAHRIDLEFENETVLPRGRLKTLGAKLLNDARIGRAIRSVLPQSAIAPLRKVIGKLRGQVYKGGEKPGKIPAEDRALIAPEIEADIDRLEKILGRDLSVWRA
ncbi:sulfotransferase [Qipengyuania sp. 1NDH17]|uniref:Sulfotransferase n=1 Tax=Qipengyuania polymorpha TaxID=2867234 RepID=A0ABS7IW20_9SPHN|nr:sulfotransferase [Qipengyuania polymorpha]MBX7457698.1 sulfotransferase [Qipengyuania polymorpha]